MTYLTKEDWEKHYVQKICDDKSFSALINENLKIKSNFIFLINKLFNPKNKEALQHKKLLKELLFPSLNFFHKYTLSSGVSLSNLPYTEVLTLDINDLIKNKEFEILLLIQFDINFDCPFRNNCLIKNYLTKIKQSEEMIKTIVKYVFILLYK